MGVESLVELIASAVLRVDMHVLVVLARVLGKVRAVPKEATAEPLVGAARDDREQAVGLCAVQQYHLVWAEGGMKSKGRRGQLMVKEDAVRGSWEYCHL